MLERKATRCLVVDLAPAVRSRDVCIGPRASEATYSIWSGRYGGKRNSDVARTRANLGTPSPSLSRKSMVRSRQLGKLSPANATRLALWCGARNGRWRQRRESSPLIEAIAALTAEGLSRPARPQPRGGAYSLPERPAIATHHR